MTATVTPVLEWDEYQGAAPYESDRWASSDRGWCGLETAHPDQESVWFGDEYRCCGHYLQYSETHGPAGESYHAVAFVLRLTLAGRVSHSLGYAWFWTAEDCKAWIERAVRDYLDRQ